MAKAAAPSPPASSVSQQIGATAKRLRNSLGLTLGDVAKRANLSAAIGAPEASSWLAIMTRRMLVVSRAIFRPVKVGVLIFTATAIGSQQGHPKPLSGCCPCHRCSLKRDHNRAGGPPREELWRAIVAALRHLAAPRTLASVRKSIESRPGGGTTIRARVSRGPAQDYAL